MNKIELRPYQIEILRFLQPCEGEYWLRAELIEHCPIKDRAKVESTVNYLVAVGLLLQRESDKRVCITQAGVDYQID